MATPGVRAKIIIQADPELADLIPGYLETRRGEIPVLVEALARGDFEAVRTIGHKMKGTGASYGFEALTLFGSRLEDCAAGADRAGCETLVDELRAYHDGLEVVYVAAAA